MDEITVMNGIKSTNKERSYSNETDGHQLPMPDKEQSNEKEKKVVDSETPSGFSTMSPLQKFFFALSLLLSVLYVVAFGWLIPCKLPDKTGNAEPIIVTEEWKLNFSGIGVSTSILLLKRPNNGSLLFGYESLDESESGGLISIHDDGRLLWKNPLQFIPRSVSCDSLEDLSDSTNDCIVVGDNGYVAKINHAGESLIWTKQSSSLAYEAVSVPAVIPDCDSDGVVDLVLAYSEFSSTDGRFPDSVSIEILSGQTGNTIGSRKHVPECISAISKLQLWKRETFLYDILFHCNDINGFGNIWKLSTKELCSAVLGDDAPLHSKNVYRIEEPKYKQFNVLYEPTKNIFSSGEDMLLAWKGGNIILLDKEGATISWSYSSNTSAEVRALLVGKFMNDSENQVAMINSNQESGSVLTVLQTETGKKLMSAAYRNYFVAEAVPIQKVFFGMDGILLKHIKLQSKVTLKDAFSRSNFSSNRYPVDKVVTQEEYLISRPGCTDNESLKFVTSEKVTKLVQQNSTTFQARVELNQIRVAVRHADANNSLELFTASTSSFPAENTDTSQGMNIETLTTVKLQLLSHTLFSRNNTCECSC